MKRSLAGLRILVTRPSHQAKPFSDKLVKLGATVIEAPLIWIGPPESWEPLDKAISALDQYDWIIFASVNAVESLFDRVQTRGFRISRGSPKLAAIGPSTAAALEKRGYTAAFHPRDFIAESLVESFPGYPNLQGLRVLWPKTNVGRLLIADKLASAGASVDVVHCYKTEMPANARDLGRQLAELLEQRGLDVITITSAQTAKNLGTALRMVVDEERLPELLKNVEFVVIGPETAKAAHEVLGDISVKHPDEYTSDAMIALLCGR